MSPWLTVVGIGEDGFKGLGRNARHALLRASQVFGGARQLALLPPCINAQRRAWPSPFSLEPVLAQRGNEVCVLASGDPMLFGVGASLSRVVANDEMLILPAPSSYSLAAARLGWPLQEVVTLSVVARPLAALNLHLHHGVRLLVLSNDGSSPAAIAQLLRERGFGASPMTVLEHLGGTVERRVEGLARDWSDAEIAALNLVAIDCRADAGTLRLSPVCGLPDAAFKHDGQLTKRDVRAITLARLAPLPDELLWDVGAGCGSIGIEWMRAYPTCRALAIEADEGRQQLIELNRDALGVPGLQLIRGSAPEALSGLETPDAIFIGGGVTCPGVLEQCWQQLRSGGRLVANAVTLQSEMMLMTWREQHGGELTRIQVAHAKPLGDFDTWRQALPITLWEVIKP
jgi:precorrin-6Y C5,15-methyltransferase (decarboxylating)